MVKFSQSEFYTFSSIGSFIHHRIDAVLQVECKCKYKSTITARLHNFLICFCQKTCWSCLCLFCVFCPCAQKVQRCVLWCFMFKLWISASQVMCKSMYGKVPNPWILKKNVSSKYKVKFSCNQCASVSGKGIFCVWCAINSECVQCAIGSGLECSAVQRFSGAQILAKVSQAWAASPDKWYHTWPSPAHHHYQCHTRHIWELTNSSNRLK